MVIFLLSIAFDFIFTHLYTLYHNFLYFTLFYDIILLSGCFIMFYVKFNNKDNSDAKVYIKHSYSVNGVKKQLVIEKYDSINQLTKEHGNWEVFIKNRVKELNDDRKNKKVENEVLTLDFTKKLNDNYENDRNFGYLLLQSVYYDLDINSFLYHYKNIEKLKIKYSLNDAMKLLVFSRIINPGSKLKTSKTIKDYAEDFDLSLDDIYHSLDHFYNFKDKFQQYLYKKASSICKPGDTVVYYDVTNFYYEVESESELIAYGVEKNHRPDPITSFGLFMDSNGLPIRFSSYRGNISESKQMLPNWKLLRKDLSDNDYIVCADSGMNSADIKKYIQDCKDHFIFSQSVLKLNESEKKEILDDSFWETFASGKKYKVKKIIKDSFVHDKNATRKDGKIKTSIDAMYIYIFDQKRRDYILNKLKEREEKARDIINNPSKYDKISSKDGKQYIKKIVYDNNGEIITEQSELVLDFDTLDKEKKFAGYGAIVTDLFEMDVKEIIKIAARRYEIEDCFRQMKTGFSTRPVFVYKTEHIHAHFLICYVALMIMKLLENHYLKNFTADQLFNILRTSTFTHPINSSSWMVSHISLDAINAFNAMGLESIMYEFISNKTLNYAISITKNRR